MLEHIQCIVLRTVKYGDNALIVDTFTESHGRMSFVTKISHTRRSHTASAFWQPLSILEFNADIRPTIKLPTPTGVRFLYSYQSLPYNPSKACIAMFIAEFLCAALRGEGVNKPLFQYIEISLRWLDMAEDSRSHGIANFHLVFLMRTTRFLGIYPNLEKMESFEQKISQQPKPYWFDLIAGEYSEHQPVHSSCLRPDEAALMPLLFRMDYSTMHVFRFNRQQRQRCLEVLIEYYRIHVPQFPELKSLDVLAEIFN